MFLEICSGQAVQRVQSGAGLQRPSLATTLLFTAHSPRRAPFCCASSMVHKAGTTTHTQWATMADTLMNKRLMAPSEMLICGADPLLN